MSVPCVLTVCGMASALGNAVHGCAALRAGIVRPCPIPEVEVVDIQDQLPVAIVGHPVQGVTDGFPLATRWIRLAVAAFSDFNTQPSAPVHSDRTFWQRCGLVLVLPPIRHERFQTEDDDCTDAIRLGVVEPLVRFLGLPIASSQVQVIDVGHAGTALALVGAQADVELGRQDACLIIAIDSLLDSLSLEWLLGHGRLKCDGQPCGLAPGEAGVCLLMELATTAAARGAAAMVSIVGTAYQAPTDDTRSVERAGRELAETFAIASAQGTPTAPFVGQIITDLNGETERSQAFAIALQTLEHQQRLTVGEVVMPAVGLGDTGAASGAIGLCIAAHTFRRRPQAPGIAAIVSLSERGDRGVVIAARVG